MGQGSDPHPKCNFGRRQHSCLGVFFKPTFEKPLSYFVRKEPSREGGV